jgi:hypothetical protein
MAERHYTEIEWLAYFKDTAPDQAVMTEHLKACAVCQDSLAFCREIAYAITNDEENPPHEWIRDAVTIHKPESIPAEPSQVFVGLAHDTSLNTTCGVRSLLPERRLRFESDRYHVDVTAELTGRRLTRITGQVRGELEEPNPGGLQVELFVAARTYSCRSSPLGEFYFSLDEELTGDPLELRILLGKGPCLTALIPF